MSNPLEIFAGEIIDSEFGDGCPSWVNYELFKQEMIGELMDTIETEYESGQTQLGGFVLEGFMCPFVSSNVDMGAHGGLDGKYSEVYKFPKELRKFLNQKLRLKKKLELQEKLQENLEKQVYDAFTVTDQLPENQRSACVHESDPDLRKQYEEDIALQPASLTQNRMKLNLFKAQKYPVLFEQDTGLNAEDYANRILQITEMIEKICSLSSFRN